MKSNFFKFAKGLFLMTVLTVYSSTIFCDEPVTAMSICNAYKVGEYQTECLEIIKDATFQTGALKVCADHTKMNFSNECLIAIKNINTFSPTGLRVCQDFNGARPTNDCLFLIAHGRYEDYQLKKCGDLVGADDTLECIKCADLSQTQHCSSGAPGSSPRTDNPNRATDIIGKVKVSGGSVINACNLLYCYPISPSFLEKYKAFQLARKNAKQEAEIKCNGVGRKFTSGFFGGSQSTECISTTYEYRCQSIIEGECV